MFHSAAVAQHLDRISRCVNVPPARALNLLDGDQGPRENVLSRGKASVLTGHSLSQDRTPPSKKRPSSSKPRTRVY